MLGGPEDQLLPVRERLVRDLDLELRRGPEPVPRLPEDPGDDRRVPPRPHGDARLRGRHRPRPGPDDLPADPFGGPICSRSTSRRVAGDGSRRGQLGSLGAGPPDLGSIHPLRARHRGEGHGVALGARTSTVEQLAGYDFTRFHVTPGAVGERYATWSVCGPLTCTAWIHDTELGTTRRIPAPDGRARYAPVGVFAFAAGIDVGSRCPSRGLPDRSTCGSRGSDACRSRGPRAAPRRRDRLTHPRSSGLVRQVGPPPPFREISSPS